MRFEFRRVKLILLSDVVRIRLLSHLSLRLVVRIVLHKQSLLLLLLHVRLDLLLGQLVVAMLILALVLRIKEKVITFSTMDRRFLQILPENGNLGSVVHVVSEKLLLRVKPLLTGC